MRKIFLIPLFFLFACELNNKQEKKQIIQVEGKSTGLPDGMLYLADATNWRSILDSARCQSGSFRFHFEVDSPFTPQAMAIQYYPDGDRQHPVRLQFLNHVLADAKPPLQRDFFWLESGTSRIEGKNHPDSLLRIHAGAETDLMMQHQLSDIGWMGEQDSLIRANKLLRLEKEIRQHPGSFFLLESIRRSKELYSKEELSYLLGLFDSHVKKSLPATKLSISLNAIPDKGQPYPLLYFPGPQQMAEPIIDTSRELNMLVFWASWCKPCREEIPILKKLQVQFADAGLAITSISIDTDRGRWQQALNKEQMPWRQLIIPVDRIASTENIFRFTSIPFLVFTDRRGVEITRFADYEESALARYESLIRSRLSSGR